MENYTKLREINFTKSANEKDRSKNMQERGGTARDNRPPTSN